MSQHWLTLREWGTLERKTSFINSTLKAWLEAMTKQACGLHMCMLKRDIFSLVFLERTSSVTKYIFTTHKQCLPTFIYLFYLLSTCIAFAGNTAGGVKLRQKLFFNWNTQGAVKFIIGFNTYNIWRKRVPVLRCLTKENEYRKASL